MRLINRLKNMKDIYKLWLFIIALFATNGFQAMMNTDTEDQTVALGTEVIVKVADVAAVAKVAEVAKVAAVANCGGGSVVAHEVEHHGGSNAKVRE